MEFSRSGNDIFVRMDPGDELHESIQQLSKSGIVNASITSGIGRVRNTEIGFLDSEGVYHKKMYEEPMELLSTQGNLAPGPNGPFTHIHIVASEDDHTVRGGHLFTATVAVTAEIHLRVLGDNERIFEREKTENDFIKLTFCNIGD
tara:strand:- start:1872 stop:2309 length:438 start_codon:yes stop_codon:yes gene_type:complete